MKFKVKLRLIDSSGKKHKYSLNLEEGSKFTLGRGTPGIGAELNHPTVSTAHCHLTIKDAVLHVMDNKSRNGTKLNGKAVQSAAVRVGDMLSLGVCQIEFLEAPNPPVEENPQRTMFIDVNELSPEEARALGRGVPEPRTPEPTMAMNRQALNEALAQNQAPSEGTAPIPQSDSTVENSFRASMQPQNEEPSHAIEAPAPTAPDNNKNTAELFEGTMSAYAPPSNPYVAPENPYAAPSLPDRPGSEAAPDGLRSLDSFGRGREGEYRREDDPRYNPEARNRHPRGEEEERSRSKKSKRARSETTDNGESSRPRKVAREGGGVSSHGIVSTLITFVSTAAAGSLVTLQKGTYSPMVTIASGVLGTLLIAILAWILRKQNEFMEAEGEGRDYYRFLAFSTVALMPASMLTSSAIIFRLAAFIVLGVAFFHFFMAKFRPVAEKFVFLVGSYVSVITFLGYMVGGQLGSGVVGPQQPVKHGSKITRNQTDDSDRQPADDTDENPSPDQTATPQQQPEQQAQQNQQPQQQPTQAPPQQPEQQAQQNQQPQQQQQQPTQAPPQQPQQQAQTEQPQQPEVKKPGPDSFAISQLYKAAERGDVDIVKKLVQEKGVNPNTVAENGVTALMLASYYGHGDTARYLLQQNADINLKDRQGTTALMWAVLKGNRDMVMLLVKSGASLSARRNDGDTALDIARLWHYDDVIKILEDPERAKKGLATTSHSSSRKPSSTKKSHKSSSSKKSKSSKKKKYSATEDDDS